MSVESIAIALNHSRATGTAKLVLIGIANHDGDGGAWPSVATLARYAGVAPRNVQVAVRKLEELHEIVRQVQAGGTTDTPSHMRPNRYHFALRCPVTCDHTSRHRVRGETLVSELSDPLMPASPGVASVTPGGDGSVTRTVLETSIDQVPEVSTDRTHACSGSASGRHHFDEHTGWCTNACGSRSSEPIGVHA